jgi:hypothetical protein
MTTVAIGTPQYGGKKKLNFKLQDGENIYRILPPLGELAADGTWAVYQCQHWGYKGSKGMRPFLCIQKKDFKTKMIKVQCPECDKIAEKNATLEDHKTRLKAEGKTDAQIEEQLKPLSDYLYAHNLDKKWFVNALTQDGKIGRLAIPHKMYVQLQETITDLVTKKSIDPIGVDGGVWFNLIRSGKGNQTSHRVTLVEEGTEAVVGGKKITVAMVKSAPLTPEVIARLGAEAYDLKASFRALTYDEIKRIVSSGGDPDIVDSVFSAGDIQPRSENVATGDDEPEAGAVASSVNVAPVVAPAVTSTPTAAQAQATQVEVVAVDPTVAMRAQFEAQLKAMQAQFAAQLAATPAAVPATTVTVTQPAAAAPAAPASPAAAMNDDDFIKQFGFKTAK